MSQYQVTYIHSDGTRDVVDVEPGTSVMVAATSRGIRGVVGECGGAVMCATCHVYVDSAILDEFEPMEVDEDEMLDEAAAPRRANSRLSCQLVIGEGVDSVVVEVPTLQGTVR